MFAEIVKTITKSKMVDKIIVVSKNNDIISDEMTNTIHLYDEYESGVNNAISIADKYICNNKFDASVIFPQDIPLIKSSDIKFLLSFNSSRLVFVVPSKRFDGTNALVRTPTDLMETHYDEDSYKIHLRVGKKHTNNTSLVLIKRIMFDIDNYQDLKLLLKQNEKPDVCKMIQKIAYS